VRIQAKLLDQRMLTPAIGSAQPAFRVFFAGTLTGEDSNGRHEPGRVSRRGFGNPQHVSTAYPARALADSQREEETTTGRKAVQPQRLGMGCSRVHEDGVAGTRVARPPVSLQNLYVGVRGEVGTRSVREVGIDLHRRNMAGRSDDLRNDCRVVSNATANV